jgi:hypothetical protein
MNLRAKKGTNKDGISAKDCQLAHNERHPVAKKPVVEIFHIFGRAEELACNQLALLLRSIARVYNVEIITSAKHFKKMGEQKWEI